MTIDRKQNAYRVRVEAADLARHRPHVPHIANGDEQRFASANYAMSFTKGLHHDAKTGLVVEPGHFEAFRHAIDEGYVDPFTVKVAVSNTCGERRKWEAPTAGLAYDLQGPDAQAVTMPPAPALGSDELAYEMAEVYELALLRDEPLTDFRTGSSGKVTASTDRLNALAYNPSDGSGRLRITNAEGNLTVQNAFRGSSPGVDVGHYLSQFMMIGNVDQPGVSSVRQGLISYGALQASQCVPVAAKTSFMTNFDDWCTVQNGCVVPNTGLFEKSAKRRFISTPRDLATYVHYDALYEAYLNACLILLGMGTPFDPGFANLSGQRDTYINGPDKHAAKLDPNSQGHAIAPHVGGFALYGGPHILTLVTEVATRALKAVRYQKFNNHIRLRPEALAARIEKASDIEKKHPIVGTLFSDLGNGIAGTVKEIRAANKNTNKDNTALLPMAFPEGSPMHPSYGAGHATVAGACVTILKAFFDTSTVFVQQKKGGSEVFARPKAGDTSIAFVPNKSGSALVPDKSAPTLTLEGELNKLAANISIARNMAGVHYFSDYYDSLRMGEEIAIGLLEEQALCYPTDPFVMTIPTFDGGVRSIGRR